MENKLLRPRKSCVQDLMLMMSVGAGESLDILRLVQTPGQASDKISGVRQCGRSHSQEILFCRSTDQRRNVQCCLRKYPK